jgi:8-oxo-dGTP diphosphatase
MKTDLTVAGYIFHEDKLLLIHHNKLNKWLPVGGHIDENEVPDDALAREIKEETNLDVKIFHDLGVPKEGNIVRATETPFHTNVHSVGDHNHYCSFYVCKALNPETLQVNEELKGFKWVTKSELEDDSIPSDVKNQALKAFGILENN